MAFIGAGGGIGLWNESDTYYNDDSHESTWYGFLEARFDFPSASRLSFFETNKIGIGGNIGDRNGGSLYLAPAVGAKYQINTSFGLNLSLGYHIGPTICQTIKINGLALSLGIEFQP